MRDDSDERRVRRGFAIIAGIILIGVLIFNADTIRDRIRGYTDVVALVDQTSGVRAGSPVRVNGVRAGRVLDVGVVAHGDSALIGLDLRIEDHATPVLRQGARATTAKRRFIGQPMVQISTDEAVGPALATGDTLYPDRRPDLDALLARAREFPPLLDSLRHSIVRLDSLASLRRPRVATLTGQAAATLEEAGELVDEMTTGEGSLGLMLNDPALPGRIREIRGTVGRLGQAVEALGSEEGAGGALRGAPDVMDRVGRITGELDALATALESGQGTLPRLRRDSALVVAIRGVAAQIDTLRSEAVELGLRMMVP